MILEIRRFLPLFLTGLLLSMSLPSMGGEPKLEFTERPRESANLFPEFAYYPSKPVPGYPGFKAPYIKMPPEYQAYPKEFVTPNFSRTRCARRF